MTQENLEKLYQLRKELHAHAEGAGKEVRTQEILKKFIRSNTSLKIVEEGKWFYCIYEGRKEAKEKTRIAFRADMDGVSSPDGSVAHRCGHDGHSTVLAGLALELEEKKPERDVILLFQHGEETGEGARECKKTLKDTNTDEIYGFHNIPGYPVGSVLIREETFACASKGMIIHLTGKPSHAAYPEAGINPAFVIGELITSLPDLLEQKHYKGMVLCTVIKILVGDEAFGVSASEGEILLTIRAHYEEDLEKLQDKMERFVKEHAQKSGLEYSFAYSEEFPETRNYSTCVETIKKVSDKLGLLSVYPEEPFRWSEDFGHYLKDTKGAFFGIGDGETYTQLHTETYEFPDEIIKTAVSMFYGIIEE
ncbi:amidohydrolase [Velocimicrobium porci]|uniref:Amidohydrolase n=1 Tax=Velocimicrobium porci TaxID=2606634 RepID=A0A6L5XXB8_9FIRM|nr:amidohydrolase [Velocimicrobium porci]MSS63392.1 amidohydrolase [Velocimicrobium porci]